MTTITTAKVSHFVPQFCCYAMVASFAIVNGCAVYPFEKTMKICVFGWVWSFAF